MESVELAAALAFAFFFVPADEPCDFDPELDLLLVEVVTVVEELLVLAVVT